MSYDYLYTTERLKPGLCSLFNFGEVTMSIEDTKRIGELEAENERLVRAIDSLWHKFKGRAEKSMDRQERALVALGVLKREA